MTINVVKRDSVETEFKPQHIINAIIGAVKNVRMPTPSDYARADFISAAIHLDLNEKAITTITVIDIQSKVEELLMQHMPDIARAYIEYRHDRDNARETQSSMYKAVQGLLSQTDEMVMNENANKDAKEIPTKRDLLAGIFSKHHAMNHLLPKHIANAHLKGEIHFHDADYSPLFPMFNCMLVDLKGMLANGYKLGNASVTSPNSIGVACAQTAQIIARVSSCIYGGTSIADIDEALAPFVAKSRRKIDDFVQKKVVLGERVQTAKEMLEKEVYDAVQALEYEVNTLYSANGQTPFVTFGFGRGTSTEAVMIQKAILQVRIKGIGSEGETPVFPKLVFKIAPGLNQNKKDPNYHIKQLALECATKRMYPDILRADSVTSMGCRSFLDVYIDENGREVWDGRNNLGVVSLNLPRIAIESRGNHNVFMGILKQRLQTCREALEYRVNRLRDVRAEVAPILYCEGACGKRLNPEDKVFDALFANGRASVSLGYIGLHEVANAMYPDDVEHTYDSSQKQVFIKNILEYIRGEVNYWKEDTGMAYSLYSTPSENLCDRFCRLDKEAFGEIKNVNDKGYYTNSFHLDVEKQVTPFQKIDYEADYHMIASGGAISYAEFPELIDNPEALEKVWDYALSKLRYFGTNTPVDRCHECGWKGEALCTSKGYECPNCGHHGSNLKTTRRVCGYLGSPDQRPFVFGKQEEVQRRVKHQ